MYTILSFIGVTLTSQTNVAEISRIIYVRLFQSLIKDLPLIIIIVQKLLSYFQIQFIIFLNALLTQLIYSAINTLFIIFFKYIIKF